MIRKWLDKFYLWKNRNKFPVEFIPIVFPFIAEWMGEDLTILELIESQQPHTFMRYRVYVWLEEKKFFKGYSGDRMINMKILHKPKYVPFRNEVELQKFLKKQNKLMDWILSRIQQ